MLTVSQIMDVNVESRIRAELPCEGTARYGPPFQSSFWYYVTASDLN